MILIKCTNETKPNDFLLVAQNPVTYGLLGFSNTGVSNDYNNDHSLFEGNGRYKPYDGSLPGTELELRTEFFTLHYEKQVPIKKLEREQLKQSSIVVIINAIECTFDMDSAAQSNVNATLVAFESARLEAVAMGWDDNGTLPWVLANNEVLPVTLSNLKVLRDSSTARGMRLHMGYNAAKTVLGALIPGGYVKPENEEMI